MNFFENTRPGRQVTHGQATFDLPILYFRDDFFGLYFTADFKKVKAIMPSERLHPLKMPNGRAIIVVAAYNYLDTTIGTYGEVPVGIPVVFNEKKSRWSSLPPLLMESNYPNFGVLVQHLPVTKGVARDAGRGEWGYTKFVADMTFQVTPEYFQCRMSEKQTHILDLHVKRKGIWLTDHKPLTTFSVRNHQLIKTVIKQYGRKRLGILPKGSYVRWGDHPMARSVTDLDIAVEPFLSMYYTERSGILASGEVIENEVRPFEGHRGEDREGVFETFYTES
ncbi:MAG: acetoacetate decarboxylase family protein [Desulfobacteraceae bacterium]|nr:acetoacetate decarboxylase family protein [Desulfobacteraceae bacterium]